MSKNQTTGKENEQKQNKDNDKTNKQQQSLLNEEKSQDMQQFKLTPLRWNLIFKEFLNDNLKQQMESPPLSDSTSRLASFIRALINEFYQSPPTKQKSKDQKQAQQQQQKNNQAQVLKMYKESSDNQDPLSSFRLAEIFSNDNTYGIPKDLELSWFYLIRSAIFINIFYGYDFLMTKQYVQKLIQSIDPEFITSIDILTKYERNENPSMLNLCILLLQLKVTTKQAEAQEFYDKIINLLKKNIENNQLLIFSYQMIFFIFCAETANNNKRAELIFDLMQQYPQLLELVLQKLTEDLLIMNYQKKDNTIYAHIRYLVFEAYHIRKMITFSDAAQEKRIDNLIYFHFSILHKHKKNNIITSMGDSIFITRYLSEILINGWGCKSNPELAIEVIQEELSIGKAKEQEITNSFKEKNDNKQKNQQQQSEDQQMLQQELQEELESIKNSQAYAFYLLGLIYENQQNQKELSKENYQMAEQRFNARFQGCKDDLFVQLICCYFLGRIQLKLYSEKQKAIQYFVRALQLYQNQIFSNSRTLQFEIFCRMCKKQLTTFGYSDEQQNHMIMTEQCKLIATNSASNGISIDESQNLLNIPTNQNNISMMTLNSNSQNINKLAESLNTSQQLSARNSYNSVTQFQKSQQQQKPLSQIAQNKLYVQQQQQQFQSQQQQQSQLQSQTQQKLPQQFSFQEEKISIIQETKQSMLPPNFASEESANYVNNSGIIAQQLLSEENKEEVFDAGAVSSRSAILQIEEKKFWSVINKKSLKMQYVHISEIRLGEILYKGDFGNCYLAKHQGITYKAIQIPFIKFTVFNNMYARLQLSNKVQDPLLLKYQIYSVARVPFEKEAVNVYLLQDCTTPMANLRSMMLLSLQNQSLNQGQSQGVKYSSLQQLTLEQKMNIAINISEGICSIHENVDCKYHGNLRDTNIYVDQEFKVYLSDWMLTSIMHQQDTCLYSDEDQFNFAYGFAAPEQISGPKAPVLLPANDVWALGVLIYELFTEVIIDVETVEKLGLYSSDNFLKLQLFKNDDKIYQHFFYQLELLLQKMIVQKHELRITIRDVTQALRLISKKAFF